MRERDLGWVSYFELIPLLKSATHGVGNLQNHVKIVVSDSIVWVYACICFWVSVDTTLSFSTFIMALFLVSCRRLKVGEGAVRPLSEDVNRKRLYGA